MYHDSFFQQKLQEERIRKTDDIQYEEVKAMRLENVRIQAQKARYQLREQEEERKRSIYCEVILNEDGELYEVTRNLSFAPYPRQLTNMKKPTLQILTCASVPGEQIYVLNCFQGEVQKHIFLDATKAGKPSYILRKLASQGIIFFGSEKHNKKMVLQLLSLLLRGAAECELPEKAGWTKKDGKFIFIRKEDLTWSRAVKLTK